jgi:ribonuclease D
MELYDQDRVALDVEHHSTHSYAGRACLVQLSTGGRRAAVLPPAARMLVTSAPTRDLHAHASMEC